MPPSGSIRIFVLCAALVVLTLAAFSSLLSCAFINFDDDDYVTTNARVQAGLSADTVRWAFTSTDFANWHPLTWLSHALDAELFGLDAGKHHRTSVAIHAANVLLLFLLLSRMTGALWRPALVAALFAIHPLHVESVAWIAERKDVLSTLFWLLIVFAWLHWLSRKTAARYALVLALFTLGLMAKPMLVTLPFTLLLLDYWPLKRTAFRPLWNEKLPLFALSAVSCVVTFVAQRRGGAVQSLMSFPLGERLSNAAVAYASYLGKTFWPASLSVFYPYPNRGGSALVTVAAVALLAAVTILALRFAKAAPYFAVGWLWYLGTLVPVIGLVQVGSHAMGDRYTYVPLIGIFVALSWGLADLATRARAARIAIVVGATVAVSALFIETRVQAGYWSNSETLFTHAIEVTSDNWLAQANLGAALADQGRLEDAIAHSREALRIRPAYAEAHYNLGLALAKTGRGAEAIEELERALALMPGDAKAHNNLAGVLAAEGRFPEAMIHLEQAVRLDPGNAESRYNLAGLLLDAGRVPEAIENYEAVLRVRPDDAETRAALRHAEAALGRRP